MPCILHLDMDAFFAAIEVMDHPAWAGQPLVVGSPPDRRGVVSTASYEARAYGIRSAMPSRTAYRLCPHAIFAPVRMSRYADVSANIMRILHQYTPMVEQVSVDEAFLDAQGILHRWKTPENLALKLKEHIRRDTGLTASVGVAPNKFLAKLGSDLNKPDGLTVVPFEADAIQTFLAPLPLNRIWGVGSVTEAKLHQAGFRTIGDLQQVASSVLVPLVGHALADHIARLARGQDERPVVTESAAKSISAETTFDEDVADRSVVRHVLVDLAEQVGRRLRQSGFVAGTVHIKLRFEDFQTITRQETAARPFCSDRRLLDLALALFDRQKWTQPVRLVGVGVGNLAEAEEEESQLRLFPDPADDSERKQARLDKAMDDIREKLGKRAIQRAAGMDGKEP